MVIQPVRGRSSARSACRRGRHRKARPVEIVDRLVTEGRRVWQSGKIVDAVAQELDGKNAQLVVICGRNEETKAGGEQPVRMESGFVSDMNLYMEASDVLLTKAGPGRWPSALRITSTLRASCRAERGNVLWVREKNIGELAKSPRAADCIKVAAGPRRSGRNVAQRESRGEAQSYR